MWFFILGHAAVAERTEEIFPTVSMPPIVGAPSCFSVFIPNTMLSFNNLTITYDNLVFWKGKPVQLKTHDKGFKKNSRVLLRMLLNLVDHPYEVLSAEDLFSDAWVTDRKFQRSPEEKVHEAALFIRQAFVDVDETFDAIKIDRDRKFGVCWDDGLNRKVMFPEIPELRLTKYETRWNGKLINISISHRRMIRLLVARADRPVSNEGLYRAFRGKVTADIDNDAHVAKVVNAELVNIRREFRRVDPAFDRIVKSHLRAKKWKLIPLPPAQSPSANVPALTGL